jgi:uncharacterized RDD family membrane protein YckC
VDEGLWGGSGAESYAVETPEQVELHFPLAGLGSRFLALMIDILIQIAANLVLGIVIVIVFSIPATQRHVGSMSDTAAKWFVACVIFVYFLLYWGYFSLFEAFRNGQTPGKRVMKIRVIKDSGRQITFFEALARNLLRVIDLLPGMFLVGAVSIMVTRQNKRLGDLVADTLVVHERVDEYSGYASVPASRSFSSGFGTVPEVPAPVLQGIAADAVARLSSDDLHVMDTYLARAIDLPLATRAVLASRILDGVCARMGVPVPVDVPPERTLEALAYRLRSRGNSSFA